MLGSYFLLFFTIIALFINNSKLLVLIIFISLLNDLFTIPFGFNLPIHNFISLLFIPKVIRSFYLKKNKFYNYGVNFLFIEQFYLIIITIFFGIIIGWHTEFDYMRDWNQKTEMKSIIQIFKLIADLSLFFLFIYLTENNLITLQHIDRLIKIVYISMILIGIFDLLTNHFFKNLLFSSTFRESLFDRFTSLNGEPRAFAKSSVFVFIYSIYLFQKRNLTLVFLSIFGVLLSLSASGFLILILIVVIILIFKKHYLLLSLLFSFFILAFSLINNLDSENQKIKSTLIKINFVLGTNQELFKENEDIIPNEPKLFKSFEIFDRAALNFLFINPIYFVTGVGSNLISLPASPYINSSSKSIYGDKIDSAPHSFIINLLARSGLIGILLWLFHFFKSSLTFNKISRKLLFLNITNLIFLFIINNPFYFITLAISINFQNSNKQINVTEN